MLEIKNLHVSVDNKQILRGVDLILPKGQVHAIMGPNGAGKSTLANLLAGREGYEVTQGEILFKGKDLLTLLPEERAHAGMFLGFQYPVEIPGVSNIYFLKAAFNAARKAKQLPEIDAMDFLNLVRDMLRLLEMDESMMYRAVNEGFSGGEKKRNEILQMLVLNPLLAVLDETDSGLDIDALQVIALGINSLRSPEHSILMITHYQRLLNFVKPDVVHVLVNGRILKSGDAQLAHEVEAKGYSWIDV